MTLRVAFKPTFSQALSLCCTTTEVDTTLLTRLMQGISKDSLLPQFVLEVDSIHDVPPSRGKQVVPTFRRPGGALGEAFGKERALLQVCIAA